MKDTYILGLHGFSAHSKRAMHNSGVALLKNGKIIFASDEERYSRIKNDGAFPFKALDAMYKELGLSPKDISYIAMPDRKPLWQLMKVIKYTLKTFIETGVFASNYLSQSFRRSLHFKRMVPENLRHCKLFFIEHHLAHAASAYYSAPWNEATVITIDGSGDFSMSGIVGIGQEEKIEVIKRLNGYYSPGIYYMMITEILGFISGRHEGKVTGLAAFGKPNVDLQKKFKILLQYNNNKLDFFSKNIAFEINDYISKHWVNGYNPELGTGSVAEQAYKNIKEQQLSTFRIPLTNHSKEDIAYAAQNRLEEVVLDHVNAVVSITGIKNVCLAGGLFANVKLNQKIKELENVKNMFVYPAMNDSGLSVGAALFVHHNVLKNEFNGKIPTNLYLGSDYNNDYETEKMLNANNIRFEYFDNIELKIAEALSSNKIVAHFFGRSEYGPRALGNRSIFAPSTNFSINETLNKKLNRTEFMPFAPVLLFEDANEMLTNWSADDHNSRFMTITYNVTQRMKEIAPAVVHIDGTARPQIINYPDNKRVYGILKEYKKITGSPVLINTSFNLHEEPIVNSPKDALRVLEQKAIDVLIINNFYIEKK